MKETNRMPSSGEKHYTSTVFIISKERPRRVLLVHHKKIGKWMPPGGHQEPHENSRETAIEEVRQETGIDISDYLAYPARIDDRAISLPLPQYMFEERIDAHGKQPSHFHLDMIYVVEVPMQEVTRKQDESHGIGWFAADEVQTLDVFDNVRTLLGCILEDRIE